MTVSPSDFLNSIKDDQIRGDCGAIAGMMEKATKTIPEMWGPSIVRCRIKKEFCPRP
jgi:hypothetical protein